jgi:hypothetical protein
MGLKTKLLISALNIEAAPRLSVRFVSLPSNFTCEAGEAGDKVYQLRYPDLVACSDIYRFALIVVDRGAQNSLRTILDIQKIRGKHCRCPTCQCMNLDFSRASTHLRIRAGITRFRHPTLGLSYSERQRQSFQSPLARRLYNSASHNNADSSSSRVTED